MSTLVVSSCDCGFRSKPTTEGYAAYALRKHSCERHRREAASAARGRARHAAIDRTPKDCFHKVARHEHGTHACYVLDRCKCLPCAVANAAYEQQRTRQRAYGRTAYIDAQPVREHVRALMDAGVGLKQIVKVAGISSGSLFKIMYGKRGADGVPRPSANVKRETAAKILAVRADFRMLAGGARVDPTGTRRRLQALVVAGWSQSKLSERLGLTRSNFGKMVASDQVTARTARQVAELYERLWDTAPPELEHRDKIAASRARNVARRYGWQPALAWDDDTIDEPTARPMLEAEPVGDLDEVAVLRIMAGTLRLPSHDRSPERTEAIRRMAARGLSDQQVGGYLGMSRDAVLKVRERNGIPSYVTDYARSSPAAGYGPALRSTAGRTA